MSSPCWGWAGQKGAVGEQPPVVTGLCKGKQELPEREANASPGAVISVLLGWRASLPRAPVAAAFAGAALCLCQAGWGLLPPLALGLRGGGQFTFHLNCYAGSLHPNPSSSSCCRVAAPSHHTLPSPGHPPAGSSSGVPPRPRQAGGGRGLLLPLRPRAAACCLSPALGPGVLRRGGELQVEPVSVSA